MSLPQVNLNTGKITWTDPTQNSDGSAITAGEVTGYLIGVRSLTATGSVVGTYPIKVTVAGATAVSEALSAITPMLKPDDYAVAGQTVSATNGNSPWSAEFQFTGVLPAPNPPQAISVA